MARAHPRVSKGRPFVEGTADRPKKVGWQVSESVVDAVKEAVANGAAESQNAFVEDALRRRLKELRRAKVYSAYEEAAQDPIFMEDMRSISEAFDGTVRDGFETES
jgi:hypothetical protein